MSPGSSHHATAKDADLLEEDDSPLLKAKIFCTISGGCCLGGVVLLVMGTAQSEYNFRLLRIAFVAECACVFFAVCSVIIHVQNDARVSRKWTMSDVARLTDGDVRAIRISLISETAAVRSKTAAVRSKTAAVRSKTVADVSETTAADNSCFEPEVELSCFKGTSSEGAAVTGPDKEERKSGVDSNWM